MACERAAGLVDRMRAYLLSRGLPESELVEVERLAVHQGVSALGHPPENRLRSLVSAPEATDVRGSQPPSQEAKPSWKDIVKKQFGIKSDTPEIPPKAPAPPDAAAAAAQKRGPQRDNGPSR